MVNFKSVGDDVTFTAPTGGVVTGTAYKIGQILVVATETVAATLSFEGKTRGVFVLPKATGSWTEGALLYWDNTAKNVTTTSTSNLLIGCATAAAGSSDTTGSVRLNGIARADGA